MLLNLLLLFDDQFFKHLVIALDRDNRILLSVNLSFPVALHSPNLLLMLSQLLIQCLKLVIKLLLFLLDLADVLLQSRPLVVQHRLSLLDFVHVVLHLGLEVALEEVEQVILDVDLLDLIVDGLQLRVNLIFFHFSQASQFSAHLHNLILFLVLAVLLALFVNLGQDLRLYQIELKVDFNKSTVLFDQKRQDVSRFLSQSVASEIKRLEPLDEF